MIASDQLGVSVVAMPWFVTVQDTLSGMPVFPLGAASTEVTARSEYGL